MCVYVCVYVYAHTRVDAMRTECEEEVQSAENIGVTYPTFILGKELWVIQSIGGMIMVSYVYDQYLFTLHMIIYYFFLLTLCLSGK
jgi:hypothetical protein